MNNYKSISREEFMSFFRDDIKLNELTTDDRIETFSQVLIDSSDITKDLLENLISDYSAGNLKVIETVGS